MPISSNPPPLPRALQASNPYIESGKYNRSTTLIIVEILLLPTIILPLFIELQLWLASEEAKTAFAEISTQIIEKLEEYNENPLQVLICCEKAPRFYLRKNDSDDKVRIIRYNNSGEIIYCEDTGMTFAQIKSKLAVDAVLNGYGKNTQAAVTFMKLLMDTNDEEHSLKAKAAIKEIVDDCYLRLTCTGLIKAMSSAEKAAFERHVANDIRIFFHTRHHQAPQIEGEALTAVVTKYVDTYLAQRTFIILGKNIGNVESSSRYKLRFECFNYLNKYLNSFGSKDAYGESVHQQATVYFERLINEKNTKSPGTVVSTDDHIEYLKEKWGGFIFDDKALPAAKEIFSELLSTTSQELLRLRRS